MIAVPLVDLKATFHPIKREVMRAFEEIFDNMQLFQGPNLRALEEEFTSYCRATQGLTCSNGTDALTLALRAFDFPPGFEAIIPSHTFFATVESVVHAGGVPVMVDIDPKTYCMDPERIPPALTDKTKVIVPVHIYGHPADMDAIHRVAGARGLTVIEDAAQAHGTKYKGQPAGSLADASSFSFYFTKNLGAFGEAGFCTAKSEAVFERMQLLRHHGHASKFEHVLAGFNLRMDEIQAAVLRAKLPSLDANNARRREIAQQYNDAFADLDIVTPHTADYALPNFHCYVMQTGGRDDLVRHLAECKVGTGIHYKTPSHLQPAVRTFPHRAMPMPVTESVCSRCITLPCYPEMSETQTAHVIDSVKSFYG